MNTMTAANRLKMMRWYMAERPPVKLEKVKYFSVDHILLMCSTYSISFFCTDSSWKAVVILF